MITVLLEQRQVDCERRCHARLAAATADDAPQIADAVLWQAALAGNDMEQLALLGGERQGESRLERDQPGLPGRERAEPGAKHSAVA